MSGGRSFVKNETNLSPEERISELERKYEIAINRIKSYDEFLSDSKKTEKRIDEIERLEKNNNEFLLKLREEINLRINNIISTLNRFKDEIDYLNAENQHNTKEISRIERDNKNQLEVISSQHIDVESKIRNITSQSSNHSDKISSLYDRLIENSSLIESFFQRFQDLSKQFDPIHQKIDHLSNFFDGRVKAINELIESKPKIQDFISTSRKIIVEEINSLENKIFEKVKENLSSLINKLKTYGDTAESVRSEISRQMDLISLDSKNAIIKSGNTSQQIQILEKKLENVLLLIKKHELDK